ncbi:MAG: transposase [Anaerolineae bacterium]|nr:transposase [Anaerolineae bacterium]
MLVESSALDATDDIGAGTLAAASAAAIYDSAGKPMSVAAILVEEDITAPTLTNESPANGTPGVVEKILEIRTEYQIGALRITYYLDRYHGIKISESTVTRVLKSHGLSRLP